VISSFLIINYEIIVNLIVWSFTLKLVLQACYEYHLTWAWVPHIVTELSGKCQGISECLESGHHECSMTMHKSEIKLSFLVTSKMCELAKSINWDKWSFLLPRICDKLFAVATFSGEQKSFQGRQQWVTKCWQISKLEMRVVFDKFM